MAPVAAASYRLRVTRGGQSVIRSVCCWIAREAISRRDSKVEVRSEEEEEEDGDEVEEDACLVWAGEKQRRLAR